MVRMTPTMRRELLCLREQLIMLNQDIDETLDATLEMLRVGNHEYDRKAFVLLPKPVAKEVIATMLRHAGLLQYDRKTLERVVSQISILTTGNKIDLYGGAYIIIKRDAFSIVLPAN